MSEATEPVLCVDLDGTLVTTDTLHENLLSALAARPLALLRALSALGRGKAAFKRAVAALASIDAARLPYRAPVLDYLHRAHDRGQPLALYSAADQAIVDDVALHLGLFEHAQGSDGIVNLSGERKLAAIRARYGDDFVYLANERTDLPIWRAARAALVVGSDRLIRQAGALVPIAQSFAPSRADARTWMRALRLHQWVKNTLILVPVLLAGPLTSPLDLVHALVAIVVFGLLASFGYVVNDLLDLAADRRHPTKRLRPFAAGELAPRSGALAGAILLGLAVALALPLGSGFVIAAGTYLVATLAYSLWLKRQPLVDTMLLAALFTLRLGAGMTLMALPFSYWLLTFSMFFFLSLAMVKRYAEVVDPNVDPEALSNSRGYLAQDAPLLLAFGAASTVGASLIFVVYLVAERFPAAVYDEPAWLWPVVPLLTLWLMRMWRLALHGKMDQDPVFFALRDRFSIVLGGLTACCVLLAW